MSESNLIVLGNTKYDYNLLCKIAKTGPTIEVTYDRVHTTESMSKCNHSLDFNGTVENNECDIIVYPYNDKYFILAGSGKISEACKTDGNVFKAKLLSKHSLKKAEFIPEDVARNNINQSINPVINDRFNGQRTDRPHGYDRDNRPRYGTNNNAGGRRY